MNTPCTVVTMHQRMWLTTHSVNHCGWNWGLSDQTRFFQLSAFCFFTVLLMFLSPLETCFSLWWAGGPPFELICCCTPTGKRLKHYVFWNWSLYPTTVVWFWLLYCGLVITHCVLTAWATWRVLFIYQDAASYITNALMRCLVPVHVHLEDCSFWKS